MFFLYYWCGPFCVYVFVSTNLGSEGGGGAVPFQNQLLHT